MDAAFHVQQHYELCAGEALVAVMRLRSAWGTLATASSADGCWTFKRVGFWQNKASIRYRCGELR